MDTDRGSTLSPEGRDNRRGTKIGHSLVSTTALAGIPEFIEASAGAGAVSRAFYAADVPEAVIGRRGYFIPHRAFSLILELGARSAGDPAFGLSMAPNLHIATWGAFGAFVLQGGSIAERLQRLVRALPFHGADDSMELIAVDNELHFHYDIPSSGMIGYAHYAIAAVRYVQTIVAPFLAPGWAPLRIEFDFPKPRHAALFEDLFQCPVIFDAPRWTIVIGRDMDLVVNPERPRSQTVTLSDLRRQARPAAPTSFDEEIRELVRMQLLDGQVSIDRAGAQLGLGVRTLQRHLDSQNLAFRDIVLQTRLARASELLRETNSPITEIATSLGYSSPANFSRAFRKSQGISPMDFRTFPRVV